MRSTPFHSRVGLLLVLTATLFMAGCGGFRAGTSQAPPAMVQATAAPAPTGGASEDELRSKSSENTAAQPVVQPLPQSPLPNDPNRKIIKDATFNLEVENVETALSRLGSIAAQSSGYVLETRTDFSRNDKRSAVVKFAVPVEQFEASMQRVRETARRVISEQSSGVDVSQEFVDTQSQIANLEATQARIREFLQQATSVEDALRVNAELTSIEGQIGQLKGRLQFLAQRSAFSTVTVQVQQPLLPAQPEAAPGWQPNSVAQQAYATLTTILQGLATVVIWLGIVVLPLLLPFVLLGIIIARMRRSRAPRPEAARPQGQ